MDCPLLARNRQKPCRSRRDLFAHTLFAPEKYCKGEWFTLCPLFRQQQDIGCLSAEPLREEFRYLFQVG